MSYRIRGESRTERFLSRQQIQQNNNTIDIPKSSLIGPVRRWEKKWVDIGNFKVFKWVPGKKKNLKNIYIYIQLKQELKIFLIQKIYKI